MIVTVLADRTRVRGMTRYERDEIQAVPLADALAATWPEDHHFTAYAPIELTTDRPGVTALVRARTGPGSDPDDPNRDRTIFNTDGATLRMIALVGDIDDPVAHAAKQPASDAWRAEVEPRLDATGLAWYRTTGGARVLALLEEPFEISAPEQAAEWSARYLAWCDALAEQHGLELDRACKDATRVFRLPNVMREGKPCTAPVQGELKRVALPAAKAPAPRNTDALAVRAPDTPAVAAIRDADERARQAALAAICVSLGSWRDYGGRKHSLCGAIGGMMRRAGWRASDCAQLLRAWLPEGDPAVDVEHGVRWALRAWERDTSEVSGRAALDAIVGSGIGGVIETQLLGPWAARRAAGAPSDALTIARPKADSGRLRRIDLSRPPEPLQYVIPALELAPGKVSAIQGFANAGKTPFALLLAICVSEGLPFLGMPVRQCPVVYVDHEASGRLIHERVERMRLGLGLTTPQSLIVYEAPAFDADLIEELGAAIESHGAGVLVTDTYSSALPEGPSFNDSGFRVWADRLGRTTSDLDVLSLILLHETKNGAGSLRAISGHGSLAGALQAAIALEPSEDDPSTVQVSCSRSIMRSFQPFCIRWKDVPCEGAPTGHALVGERVDATDTGAVARSLPANAARAHEADRRVQNAGKAILAALRAAGSAQLQRRELMAAGGEGRNAGDKALARLREAGLVQYLPPGEYAITGEGKRAKPLRVAEALGRVGAFQG